MVVGDANYGEGSSREHAALSPRLLGGAAVIARSFARIHEIEPEEAGPAGADVSNPDDYERIREDAIASAWSVWPSWRPAGR